ncbi:hypothetical protein X947_5766 [Burkholderia pseudomallei MSHR7334]|nr:hypothetical protein X947_5766 [Burkholderia pseudomallei MSHR7334]
MRNAAAPPTSPPAEKPCSSLPQRISSGAPTPIAAYGGANAMTPVPVAITRMVSVSAALRPARSPYTPIASAPSGRAMKPMPNAMKASTSSVPVLPRWKKFRAM